MEEEKKKQYKLIQSGEHYSSRVLLLLQFPYMYECTSCEVYCPHVVNWQISLIPTEIASAQVKVVSDSPKKCVFNRRAGVKSQTSATEETPQSSKVQTPQNQEDTPSFVFTSSKEEFRFNFLWFVQ